jgi:hypothetical protein
MKKNLVTILSCLLTLTVNADQLRVGDIVKVSSRNPLVVLGKAQVAELDSNTITVTSDFDSYTFSRTNVVIVPLVTSGEPPSATPGGATSIAPQLPATPAASSSLQSDKTGPNVTNPDGSDPGMALLGNFSSKLGYTNAISIYQDDMAKVKIGQMDVNQLCAEAEQAIKQADQHGPERAADPEYEQYIDMLRDFVRRVKAGEKFDFPVGQQAAATSIP